MALVHLIYVSRAVAIPSMDAIVTLLDGAREHNRRMGLSGILCFGNGCYLQILEGAPVVVNRLFRRIMADPRHEDVSLLEYREVPQRHFADWHMGYGPHASQGQSEEAFTPYRFSPEEALVYLQRVAAHLQPEAQLAP